VDGTILSVIHSHLLLLLILILILILILLSFSFRYQVNEKIATDPAILNSSPEADGWLLKVS
jgi:hypothetical protein